MNKKELRKLEFAKKTYDNITNEDMLEKVKEIESMLSADVTIWDDPLTIERYKAVNDLNLSDRRLLIVFSMLDGSVAKTARFFSVDRSTIRNNLKRIGGVMKTDNVLFRGN